jgi:RNA polymerase sigma-70 factor, ECF subfamily
MIVVCPDKELVKASQSGDRIAFNKLINKYKDKISKICYRFLGNYEDAEDCAQEVFVKTYCSIKKFKGTSPFSAWIYCIAINICKRKYQTLKKDWGKINNFYETSEQKFYRETLATDEKDVEFILENKHKEQIIQTAINSLSENYKIVFSLKYIDGLSYSEISKITNWSESKIETILYRARQKLQKKLQKRGLV